MTQKIDLDALAGHMPGPWFVGAINDALFIINKPPSPSGADVPLYHVPEVRVVAKMPWDTFSEDDANARLIAAAPALLSELRAAREENERLRKHLEIQKRAWIGVVERECDGPIVNFAAAQIRRIDSALAAQPAPEANQQVVGHGVLGKSLLRPVNQPLPEGCNCKPGRCMAPTVMGMQMPCRDPQKAAQQPAPEAPEVERCPVA